MDLLFKKFSLLVPLSCASILILGACRNQHGNSSSEIDAKSVSRSSVILFENPAYTPWPLDAWQKHLLLKIPAVRFSSEGGYAYKLAELSPWLNTSSPRAPLLWILSVPRSANEVAALDSLTKWIDPERSPKNLNFHIEKSPSDSATKLSKSPLLFFYSIKSPYKSGIFAEACAYLDRWLRARQVLEASRAPEIKVELSCSFMWAEKNQLAPQQLVLTRLALPYVESSSSEFPFKTYEESFELGPLENLK